MDFRAMLKRRQYSKWDKDESDPNWGDLKHAEEDAFTLKKKEKVSHSG